MGLGIKLGIKVTGWPDYDEVLKKMQPARFNNIMHAAMNVASKPMQTRMKSSAPKSSGALSQTIAYRRLKTSRRGFVIAGRVGTIMRKGKGKYVPNPIAVPPGSKRKYGKISVGARPRMLHWPESGRKGGKEITAKNGKVFVFKSKGKWIFTKKIRTKGYTGRKFMAKSKAATETQIKTRFSKSVKKATQHNVNRYLKRRNIKIV